MTLDKLIEQIRPCPGVYIGKLSITRFQMYLYGWRNALRDRGIETQEDKTAADRLYQFHSYVGRKYRMAAEHGWSGILLQQVGHDERAALDLFFRDWDEFIAKPELDLAMSERMIDSEYPPTNLIEDTPNE